MNEQEYSDATYANINVELGKGCQEDFRLPSLQVWRQMLLVSLFYSCDVLLIGLSLNFGTFELVGKLRVGTLRSRNSP